MYLDPRVKLYICWGWICVLELFSVFFRNRIESNISYLVMSDFMTPLKNPKTD
jgi:hypothetical protein